ncbi:predicted protein [Chaetomium globosum CBS 148.51]|uniref:Uncharacterized protein n=1 Tax=Chaetomium globosum (strain ATCC 6205 / CBS 148.51 / DSM 1962 / NBRC 6347 / NRRL 1970) TaxID=306901 RepID=Q2HFL2_CHAGB|nr:uncharacterized protein CHGG_00992 [Chaetomium globosum CBS 148.51]EAQ92757.1 predicted protein [Chaetomium globosum CBS 148.51]
MARAAGTRLAALPSFPDPPAAVPSSRKSQNCVPSQDLRARGGSSDLGPAACPRSIWNPPVRPALLAKASSASAPIPATDPG